MREEGERVCGVRFVWEGELVVTMVTRCVWVHLDSARVASAELNVVIWMLRLLRSFPGQVRYSWSSASEVFRSKNRKVCDLCCGGV